MNVTDVRLDEDGDVLISSGDFRVTESDPIHIEHILISNKGYWFENPLVGVGIIDEIKGSTPKQKLKQTIRRQLVLDNYSVKNVSISEDSKIDINTIRRA